MKCLPTTLVALGATLVPGFAQDEIGPSGNTPSTSSPSQPHRAIQLGTSTAGSTGASFSLATTSSGAALTTIYLNHPSSPVNTAPGLGVPFSTGGGGTSAFVRPVISRDGSHWLIEADIDTGSTTDDNIYIFDGNLLIQEGTQAPFAPLGELWGTLDSQVGMTNAGDLLITNNLGGSAATTADDIVALRSAGGIWTELAREGGDMGPILPAFMGVTWDDSMDSPILTEAGVFGWRALLIDGTAGGTTDDELTFLGTTVLTQENVTIPTGQAGGLMDFWENDNLEDLAVSGDGAVVLQKGELNLTSTSDDLCVLLNGAVVLQENQIIPGSSFAEPIDAGGIVEDWLDEGGTWWARGNNDGTEQDWIVRNGAVIATSDALDPIVPGATEYWDDTSFGNCFFAHDGNSSGAYVIAGVTDADPASNGVLVYDDGAGNRLVLCREGDPVDADGNGMFDDDRFFDTFGNDDILLDDNGLVWFTATLDDAAEANRDQGFFRIDVGGGLFGSFCQGDGGNQMGCSDCPCGNDTIPGTAGGCLHSAGTGAVLSASGTPSVAGDSLRIEMSLAVPSSFALLSSGAAQAPANAMNPCFGLNTGINSPAFDGLRCVVMDFQRHGARPIDSNGEVGTTTNGWGPPSGPAGGLIAANGFVAGQTRHFQGIFRDDVMLGCGTGLNTSQGLTVTIQP